jgi:hypothetical protein
LIGQHDAIPADGLFPTTSWVKGQVVADRHALTLEDGQPPAANYTLAVGMYDAATGQRLPVVDGAGRSLGDTVVLKQ